MFTLYISHTYPPRTISCWHAAPTDVRSNNKNGSALTKTATTHQKHFVHVKALVYVLTTRTRAVVHVQLMEKYFAPSVQIKIFDHRREDMMSLRRRWDTPLDQYARAQGYRRQTQYGYGSANVTHTRTHLHLLTHMYACMCRQTCLVSGST